MKKTNQSKQANKKVLHQHRLSTQLHPSQCVIDAVYCLRELLDVTIPASKSSHLPANQKSVHVSGSNWSVSFQFYNNHTSDETYPESLY